MPDPALSAAIQEAYAAAPSDVVILHTLEIRHPTFTQPIRVVRNFADEESWVALGGAEVQAVLDAMVRKKISCRATLALIEAITPPEPLRLALWRSLWVFCLSCGHTLGYILLKPKFSKLRIGL